MSLALVRAAVDELAEREPECFKAFVLAVMAGLRRNEIDKLEWARFNWAAGADQYRADRILPHQKRRFGAQRLDTAGDAGEPSAATTPGRKGAL